LHSNTDEEPQLILRPPAPSQACGTDVSCGQDDCVPLHNKTDELPHES